MLHGAGLVVAAEELTDLLDTLIELSLFVLLHLSLENGTVILIRLLRPFFLCCQILSYPSPSLSCYTLTGAIRFSQFLTS